ncbi:MAG: hypothetical protein KME19_25480 [Microcoleus vaginatus WJT46-NPBG5]|jgi:hypothetical protein|nr:hypothetical protein [Microcoleus vaginatus WJT46-NPBG5]
MGTASRYWLLVRIDRLGKCRTEEVEVAKAFFYEQFPNLAEREDVPHRQLQRQLIEWFRSDDTRRQMAGVCLRCFISHQIKEFCLQLEQKFGENHDFTSPDLLPLVLDAGMNLSVASPPSLDKMAQSSFISPQQELDENQTTDSSSVTTRTLESFDPEKSNLSTWTIRIVKSDSMLKRFLLEHGIEQLTNWMILSYMNPGRLKRILSEFDRTPTEISQALQLLDSYHHVYRSQVLSQRKSGDKSRYPDPTASQLHQMAEQLSASRTISPEKVLEELQNLAQLVRADRVRARGGTVPAESFKISENSLQSTTDSRDDSSDEQSEFLADYRQQFSNCLAQAVKQVIQARFTYWQRKKDQKAQNFLLALHLFHCQGVPMKEIAPRLGFKDQPQVSRLLELKNLRTDVGRRTLLCLRDCVLELAKFYATPMQLQDLDSKVQAALGEEVFTIIEIAQKEAYRGQNRIINSPLAQKICQYLETRNEEK